MQIRGEITRQPAGKCATCGKPFALHDRVTVSGFDVLGGVVSRIQHTLPCRKKGEEK